MRIYLGKYPRGIYFEVLRDLWAYSVHQTACKTVLFFCISRYNRFVLQQS